ncbi:MAG: UDP binding domain-containing protein [Pirellulaceae bacterium]
MKLGLSKRTPTIRESSAIYVCRDLIREQAKLHIYDPRVSQAQILLDLQNAMLDSNGQLSTVDKMLIEQNVTIAADSYQAAEQAHAISPANRVG